MFLSFLFIDFSAGNCCQLRRYLLTQGNLSSICEIVIIMMVIVVVFVPILPLSKSVLTCLTDFRLLKRDKTHTVQFTVGLI